MKVFATSKRQFDSLMISKGIDSDNVHLKEQSFFISINDTCGTEEVPYFKPSKNVLVLFFDDVDHDFQSGEHFIKAFTSEQAVEVLEFIQKHKEKESCIIHCTAGVSRSGAVATFVNDNFGGSDKIDFDKNNPYILPNALVLQLLNRALREQVV